MKCPHCGIAFHDNWNEGDFYRGDATINWQYRTANCPECKEYTISVRRSRRGTWYSWNMIHPIGFNRASVPTSVPVDIATDYNEACSVLAISPKASAALSRRCLQSILRANGYKAKDLSKEIDALLGETDASKAVPQGLRDTVDSIRNFGNFSAHPVNDVTSLQIIEVEPEEAEWCLEILEEMFQHFYERPAQATARKAALNAKLLAAGKPAAK